MESGRSERTAIAFKLRQTGILKNQNRDYSEKQFAHKCEVKRRLSREQTVSKPLLNFVNASA